MPTDHIQKYGAAWPIAKDFSAAENDLVIEMECIRRSGRWTGKSGQQCGEGLSFHYERMRNILWPHLDSHRWSNLIRDEILKNKVTVIAGCKSSGKTNSGWIFLCEYFCFPEETLVLVSSTGQRELRMRIWGEISSLWESAKRQFPWLAGHMIDSKIAITTDSIGDKETAQFTARDMRKGIIGVPTLQNGQKIGLKNWIGIKQKRVRLIADEAPMMGGTFLSAFSNLDGNVSFKAVILGNPDDLYDPLGRAAEPDEGWNSSHLHPEKTTVWKTRFMGGTCINLVGTDSPNFDFPSDQPARYPYLISAEKIENTRKFHGKDSLEYFSQCIGVFKIGLMAKRVLSSELVRLGSAQDDVVWAGVGQTKVYAIDASYGGDRCVGGSAEFGKDTNGNIILAFDEAHEIPILVDAGEPEDQIARFVKEYCQSNGIPATNVFHDSTGRGSLGTSFARIWSNECNPVEFGGRPTERPVSLDMFIDDPETGIRRLMRCDEHYDRFVTELWFSVRYAVESSQIRRLPEIAKDELCLRIWTDRNGKKSVEPKSGTATKPGMKQRIGKSPDYGDWASIIVEGARRLGFEISKLGKPESGKSEESYFEQEAKRWDKAIKGNLLQHV